MGGGTRSGPGVETHQQVDGAAHAVVAAVLTHHGAVVQQPNEEPLHQGHKVLHLRLQRRLLGDAVQQAGTHRMQASEYKTNTHEINAANQRRLGGGLHFCGCRFETGTRRVIISQPK